MAKIVIKKKDTKPLPEYPPDHKLGMVVPENGSDCEKCEYVEGQKCRNKIFQKWNGSDLIPAPVNKYCCDLFETK